ncbi:MAG: CAP domain-containing protein [Gemmatimonadetes bacterium]|nr:CAP domain-containing protein [Gammaproteobacteria bacterium]MYD26549.1 CAP domain-containing protein [Gemmatimonadota bacterium]
MHGFGLDNAKGRAELAPLPGRPRSIPLLLVLIAGLPWLPGCGSDGNPAVTAPADPPPPAEPSSKPPATTVSPFSDIERGILAGINVYRGQGGTCGDDSYDPTTPVTWDDGLAEAARVHMEDLLANDLSADYHTGSDGSSIADRVTRASPQTAWLVLGENIILTQGTARDQLTEKWLTDWHESPVHCRNQLNLVFNRAGVSVGVKNGLYAAVVVFGQKAGA